MTELLFELIDKWVVIFAVLSVSCTEAFMRLTSDSVTRRRYALLSSAVIAIVLSTLWSLKEAGVSIQDGLWRGVVAAVIAVVAYDTLKSVIIHLPFIDKK